MDLAWLGGTCFGSDGVRLSSAKGPRSERMHVISHHSFHFGPSGTDNGIDEQMDHVIGIDLGIGIRSVRDFKSHTFSSHLSC
jgi:hypothetical protein